MLRTPGYIERLGVHGKPAPFMADAGALDILFDQDVPIVRRVLGTSTERAKLSFAAATTEWVAWQLDGVTDVTGELQIIESLWAAVIDHRYTKEAKRKRPPLADAAGRILFAAWECANAVLRLSAKGESHAADGMRLVLLARHLMPKSHHKQFKEWLIFVLEQRIEKFWQVEEDETDRARRLGAPVPREAFEPDGNFTPENSSAYLNAFLAGLDPTVNRYLRTGDEMRSLGFAGQAYSL